MTEFTAKSMADANELPVLHVPVGSTTLRYEGRLLAAPEWLVFLDRYAEIADRYKALQNVTDSTGSVAQRALVLLERDSHALHLDYLHAVFPPRRFKFWAPDPVAYLLRAHPASLRETFTAFFSLQARAMGHGEPTTNQSPSTDGTSSNVSTLAKSGV